MEFRINNTDEWREVVRQILPAIKYPLLLLKGNLGAGKTTFTKELVIQMESKDPVSSPTYALINEYQTPEKKIYHFDLYRLKSLEEAYDMGIEEYLEEKNTFTIIEWPEIIEDILQDYPFHELSISIEEAERKVIFN